LTAGVARSRQRLLLSSVLVLILISSLAMIVIAVAAGAARADGPVGADPSQNYPAGQIPAACDVDATSRSCIDTAVGVLDQARASLGQPPYGLPSNFDALAPEQQMFVLTDLDRVLYGLPPIPGLTAALGQDAARGVRTDSDPGPSDPDVISYTSNWAGGFENTALAYEAWMYDDGPGSGNLDCTSPNASGCWGHRHDILWQFGSQGALAMGASVGQDHGNRSGYAMLLVEGDPGYRPAYTYTWSQALADGARPVGAPVATVAKLPVTVTIIVRGPGRVVDQRGNSCSAGSCSFKETQGARAHFSAEPGAGATFVGWNGACSGRTGCTAAPSGPTTSITATFTQRAASTPGRDATPRIADVNVSGHDLRAAIVAPRGSRPECALTPQASNGWGRDRWQPCGSRVLYTGIARGRYRLRVRSRIGGTSQFSVGPTRLITIP
jgi:hypothetical protein